jgi:predicted ATP-dependent serine protease
MTFTPIRPIVDPQIHECAYCGRLRYVGAGRCESCGAWRTVAAPAKVVEHLRSEHRRLLAKARGESRSQRKQ